MPHAASATRQQCPQHFNFLVLLSARTVDPHLFFADPDVLLNADPDPAAYLMRIQIQLKKICEKLPCEDFSGDERQTNVKVKTMELVQIYCCHKIPIVTTFIAFFLFFLQFFPPLVQIRIHSPAFSVMLRLGWLVVN